MRDGKVYFVWKYLNTFKKITKRVFKMLKKYSRLIFGQFGVLTKTVQVCFKSDNAVMRIRSEDLLTHWTSLER